MKNKEQEKSEQKNKKQWDVNRHLRNPKDH